MTDLRPLALFPYPPSPSDLDRIKKAKQSLDLGFMVTPVEAVPGGPTRVLALQGKSPTFLCDHALTTPQTTDAGLERALLWTLDDTVYEPKATMIVDQLRGIFGEGVVELSTALADLVDPVESRVRFVDERKYNPND